MANYTVTALDVSPLPGAIWRDYDAGGSGNVGDLVYLDSNGAVQVTDASAAATAQALGIVVAAGSIGATSFVSGDRVTVCEYGPVGGFSSMTPAGLGYVSETAAKIADTAPSTGASVVCVVGYCESATTFFVQIERINPQAAVVSLTDSTGDSATHNDTLADGLTSTALVADNGGGTADGTVASAAAPVTLTDNTGGSGTHDDTLADGLTVTAPAAITATTPGTGADATTWTGAQCTAAYNDLVALQGKIATLVTDVTVQNQNDSDVAQKILEIVTWMGVMQDNLKECTAKIATLITDVTVQNQNDSDLAQKILEILAVLRKNGLIAN